MSMYSSNKPAFDETSYRYGIYERIYFLLLEKVDCKAVQSCNRRHEKGSHSQIAFPYLNLKKEKKKKKRSPPPVLYKIKVS